MIHWPAIIKLHGDHELIFVPSQYDWDSDPIIRATKFQTADRLYDAQGREFLIHQPFIGELEPTGRTISLDNTIQLIRLHASQYGACCVSKFAAGSHEEAFGIITK
jgi:hypothetical protein